jgi:hypothetical protein
MATQCRSIYKIATQRRSIYKIAQHEIVIVPFYFYKSPEKNLKNPVFKLTIFFLNVF